MALIFISGSVKLVDRPHHPNWKCLVDTAKEIAATSRTASEAFLTAAPALIGKVDREGLRKVVELIIPIARENWETASKLFLKSPDLLDRLGLEGLRLLADFSAFLAREGWSAAVQLLDQCPPILEELLKLGDASLIFDVCRIGRRAAQINARLAVSLVMRSPEIIKINGFAGLEKVGELALQMGGPESWTSAVSLVEASPFFLERLGFEGLERIYLLRGTRARRT